MAAQTGNAYYISRTTTESVEIPKINCWTFLTTTSSRQVSANDRDNDGQPQVSARLYDWRWNSRNSISGCRSLSRLFGKLLSRSPLSKPPDKRWNLNRDCRSSQDHGFGCPVSIVVLVAGIQILRARRVKNRRSAVGILMLSVNCHKFWARYNGMHFQFWHPYWFPVVRRRHIYLGRLLLSLPWSKT